MGTKINHEFLKIKRTNIRIKKTLPIFRSNGRVTKNYFIFHFIIDNMKKQGEL